MVNRRRSSRHKAEESGHVAEESASNDSAIARVGGQSRARRRLNLPVQGNRDEQNEPQEECEHNLPRTRSSTLRTSLAEQWQRIGVANCSLHNTASWLYVPLLREAANLLPYSGNSPPPPAAALQGWDECVQTYRNLLRVHEITLSSRAESSGYIDGDTQNELMDLAQTPRDKLIRNSIDAFITQTQIWVRASEQQPPVTVPRPTYMLELVEVFSE